MNGKRTTAEYHFGRKWICTVSQYGALSVRAQISPVVGKLIKQEDGSVKQNEKAPVYEGIGGFIYRKDFDFDSAARAAISSALNKAGFYTLEY